MYKNEVHYRETPFGFEYGAAVVERALSDEKAGWAILALTTQLMEHGPMQLHVSKEGKVRIFFEGEEWLPVSRYS